MRTAESRLQGLGVTRDAGTEAQYQKVASNLMSRYHEEAASVGSEGIGIERWCEQIAPGYQPATWRLYRAALSWWLDTQGMGEVAQAIRGIAVGDGDLPARGAAKKLKGGAMPSLEALIRELSTGRPGTHKKAASGWIAATIITGLRPTEWLDTQWIRDSEGPRLRVKNLKATNDRANGEYRTIWLHRAPIPALEQVAEHVERTDMAVASYIEDSRRSGEDLSRADAFKRHMSGIRSAISRSNRYLWPRKGKVPSLYTGRHQFAANCKAYGHPFDSVAALMGHASNATAYQHYARATSGRAAECWADPDASEVTTVRDGFASWRIRKAGGTGVRGGTEPGL